MGFSDHTISLVPDSYLNSRKDEVDADETAESTKLSDQESDQEILESTEAIYFTENVNTGVYELKVGRSWIQLGHATYSFFTFRNLLKAAKPSTSIKLSAPWRS